MLGFSPIGEVALAGGAPAAAAGAALSGASSITFAPAGNLAGAAALSGASSLSFTTAGALTAGAVLSGTSGLTFTPAASLAAIANLVASSQIVFSAAADLSIAGAASSNSGVARLKALRPKTPQEIDQEARRRGARVFNIPQQAPLAPTLDTDKVAEAMRPPQGDLVTLDELAASFATLEDDDEEAILAILMVT